MRLKIETFGRFALHYGTREVVLNGRKARALLGYLALADSGQETRERLVGLLWSETEEGKARASLRQTLYEIREAFQAVGFDKFEADKHVARIDRNVIEVDLWDVMDSTKRGEPHVILLERDRATESLLHELETIDPSFRSWLLAKRQSLHDRLVAHLEDVLRGQADAPTRRNDEQVARALTKLDPTHEEAARALIRARVAAGDVGGALGIYKALWNLLDDEYDVEPSKETQELIAGVKLGQGPVAPSRSAALPAARAAGGTALPVAANALPTGAHLRYSAPKLVVSIGAFDLAGSGAKSRHLIVGFRRELIACLVRFREWVVRDQSPAQVLPEGGGLAEYAIDANAFEVGDSVRFVLTLLDIETNSYLWSEQLNLSVENWFETQQLVVRRLASALNVHLSAERLLQLSQRRAHDLKAYDAWLLGQATFLSFDPKSWDRAADLFRQVIHDMPDFAPAYSSLAQLHNSHHIVMPGVFRDAQRTEQALNYARGAARLDPVDSRSQLCLGWSHAMAKQYEQAMIHVPLACELNENDPWTMISAANCFAFCGLFERSRAIAAHVLKLPLAPSPLQWAYHVAIRFMESDYEGCLAAADSAGDVNPNVPGYRAAALFHLGQREAARDALKHFFVVARRRWVSKEPASDEAVTHWFLHMFPIRRSEDWARLRDGLGGAGAPVTNLFHHQW